MFGVSIVRSRRLEALEREVRDRKQTMATQQTTNERLRRGRDSQVEAIAALKARIAELEISLNNLEFTRHTTNLAVARMTDMERERDEKTARIADLDLIVAGQSEVLAEKTAFVNELEAQANALQEDYSATVKALSELESDGSKNALRKSRDEARAHVKALRADLKQAQKNDTPRHPVTKKFISREEAAELEAEKAKR